MVIIVSRTAMCIPLRAAVDSYLHENADPDSNTGRARRRDLALFLEHALGSDDTPMLYDVTRSSLERFITSRLEAGDAPATVNRRVARVKSFAAACERTFEDFRADLKTVRGCDIAQPIPLSFTDDELTRLRLTAMLIPHEFQAYRALLIIELGSTMGLRCAEMCDLVIGSITDRTLFIAGKGRKYRELPLHHRVRHAYAEYTLLRAEVGPLLPHLPLLCAAWPKQMRVRRFNEKTVYGIVRDLGNACGVLNAHPHRLRHTFVRLLLQASNNNLPLVAYAARHASVQSTMRYRVPFREELEEAFAKMGREEPDK